jgi:hypothetical protein
MPRTPNTDVIIREEPPEMSYQQSPVQFLESGWYHGSINSGMPRVWVMSRAKGLTIAIDASSPGCRCDNGGSFTGKRLRKVEVTVLS